MLRSLNDIVDVHESGSTFHIKSIDRLGYRYIDRQCELFIRTAIISSVEMSSQGGTLSVVPDTWVLIPVHNRRELTVDCLRHLKETQNWEELNVVVVDDGSTDGTSSAVRTEFPSVIVLEGDGDLWWTGAIVRSMEYAVDRNASVFVWLNDDVRPGPGTLDQLSRCVYELKETVLAAKVNAEGNSKFTSCHVRSMLGVKDVDYEEGSLVSVPVLDMEVNIQYCDILSGKMVAFPGSIVNDIGFPDVEKFPHHMADYDYTLRATEAGYDVGILHNAPARDIAFEKGHPRLSSEISFDQAVKDTFDPDRHSSRSLLEEYHRGARFTDIPRPLLGIYLLARAFTALCIKMLLCIVGKHRWR